jgi:hypothetical protein
MKLPKNQIWWTQLKQVLLTQSPSSKYEGQKSKSDEQSSRHPKGETQSIGLNNVLIWIEWKYSELYC